MRRLLSTSFAEVERRAAADGIDYRLLADTRWIAGVVQLTPDENADEGDTPPELGDVALLDPRAHLLAHIGLEGRWGQVVRAMRRSLAVEQHIQGVLLRVPGEGKKTGATWLLATSQWTALAFAMEVGHLAEYEAAFRAGTLADYPLFPAGKLKEGRAHGATPESRQPADSRTVLDWLMAMEAVAGIPHVVKRGWHGWRRTFADLFDRWETSARVKDLITGHTTLEKQTQGRTRQEVYLSAEDLGHLQRGQALVEHVRTVYPHSGRGPAAGRDGR